MRWVVRDRRPKESDMAIGMPGDADNGCGEMGLGKLNAIPIANASCDSEYWLRRGTENRHRVI
jgi:hypothetical protein